MWRSNGCVLSDKDILKLLGKKIFIHPFNKTNLQSSSYDLTASIVAYRVEKIDVTDTNNKNNKYTLEVKKSLVNENNEIVINKGVLAFIQTEESIYINNKIMGTYHSKVELCKKGFSNISTTLDPEYVGTSLISIRNDSDSSLIIKVGEPFVTIMFYTLRNKCKKNQWHIPCRLDLEDLNIEHFEQEELDKEICRGKECDNFTKCEGKNMCQNKIDDNYIEIKKDIVNRIDDWKKQEWRYNVDELKKVVKSDKLKMNENRNLKILSDVINIISIVALIFVVLSIWIFGLSTESVVGKTIMSIITIIPIVSKAIETIIKNYLIV